MSPPAAVARQAAPPTIADIAARVLAACLDVRAVWSIGHEPEATRAGDAPRRLLVFASAATLQRLRASEHLHDPEIELLVVTNGEDFATAWGPCKLSGSLARWGWRQASADEAYYDESRWAQRDGGGAVVRVRRKAFLVWQADDGAPQRGETVYKG
jgi:hypothetical protein